MTDRHGQGIGWASPPVLIGILAMAVVVAASNALVTSPVNDWLTWAAFTYPFAFLVTDVMNRLFGPGPARKVIAAGFAAGVGLSLALSLAGVAEVRVALASGTAFLAAQLTDVAVFDRLRQGSWWRAPLVSSLVGATLDSALFWPLAFAGSAFEGWWTYGLVDYAVKVGMVVLALVPFRALTMGVARGSGAR